MPEETEYEKTLVRCASYDPAAFQTLYKLYFNRVYSYVALRVSNPQDAEDLVSDIFIQVIKGLRKFKNQYQFSFAAWVFTIARNTIIDFYRLRGRSPQELKLEALANQPATAFDLDTWFIKLENHAELHTLLNLLPDRRREVLTLKYFGELRNLEIAEVMGVDERTVASHLSRGLKDLYKAYTRRLEASEGTVNDTRKS